MNAESFFNQWLKKGYRTTPVRRALVELFLTADGPLSVSDISNRIMAVGLKPNKTTIYREIDFLMKQNFINELHFQGPKSFYEILKSHHHHLICRKCDSVKEIKSDEMENHIKKIQNRIQKDSDFSNVEHSLEFFGICPDCAS